MGVVGTLGGVSGYTHRPWANTFKSYPKLYFKPETVEQVQEIVKFAGKHRINLVTTGATHSPSLITYTNSWLLNLDNLSDILNVESGNPEFSDVTVQAGARLYSLNEELARFGLSLQNLGSISEQSVAGVISTGTHGSSYCHGLISEQIVSLKLVDESGKVLTLSESQNSDLFRAVLLGLGAFGVIVEATIRCVKAFDLESRAYVLDFETLLSPQVWNKVFVEAEFHRIWWYPYTDKCYVWQADRTQKPQEPVVSTFLGSRIGRLLYEFLLWISVRWFPRCTPFVERWLFKRQFNESTVTKHVGRSDREINMDCLFKQFVNEWSLPLTNGPAVLRKLRAEIKKELWYVHSPFEIRASNTTLPPPQQRARANPLKAPHKGPIYGNITRPILDPSPKLAYAPPNEISNAQLTLNLNATMFRPFKCDPDYQEWFDCFENICAEYGGKPHWAKNFKLNPWLNPENRESLEEWNRLRDITAPGRIFGSQEWLKEKGLA